MGFFMALSVVPQSTAASLYRTEREKPDIYNSAEKSSWKPKQKGKDSIFKGFKKNPTKWESTSSDI